MKKLLSTTLAVVLSMTAFAQTNFRNITVDEAIELSKKENKLIFIDFYTDWCGPCKMMAKNVFPQKHVGDYFNANFICLKLNAEKEGKDAASEFKVNAYPTFIVIDSNRKVLMNIKGSMQADDFVRKVKNELNPDMSPEKMKERYDNGERTPELVDGYALYTLQSGKEDEGMKIIGDYFNSLDDKQKRSAENFFIYKKYTTDANSPAAEYLFANFSKFDRNIRSDAAETARRLYHSEILKYLSGHIFVTKMYNPQAYEKLRQDIQDAGFDKVYPYQPVFGLIECYAKGDYNAYLDLLESTGDELAKTDFNLILLNLNRLIPVKSDEALKTRTSEYIRSVLHKLEPNTITLIGRVLTSIETE